MPSRFIKKFGDYLILFFVLQIHLSIKGSDARPGNAQPAASTSTAPVSIQQVSSPPPLYNPTPPNNEVPENHVNPEAPENQKTEENELNFQKESERLNIVESKEEEEDLSVKLQGRVVPEGDPSIVSNIGSPLPVIAMKPKAVKKAFDMTLPLSSGDLVSDADVDPDRLAYSLLASTIRTSALSRQSHSVHSGSDVQMTEDWVELELNSMISGISGVARRLNENNGIVRNDEIRPITFDSLCNFLQETGDRRMVEDEFCLICKRIIFSEETFTRALRTLPLFIENASHKYNPQSIYSILNAYKRHKDDMVHINIEGDICSEDSQCPSRETMSLKSFENSPSPASSKFEYVDGEEVASAELFLNTWRKSENLPAEERVAVTIEELFPSQLESIAEVNEELPDLKTESESETETEPEPDIKVKAEPESGKNADEPAILSESVPTFSPTAPNFNPSAVNFLFGNMQRFSFNRYNVGAFRARELAIAEAQKSSENQHYSGTKKKNTVGETEIVEID